MLFNVRSLVTKSAPRISRKQFDAESPNFMGTSIPILSTATPDMTSLSISGRQQIAKRVNFGSFLGRDFSITAQPILKKVYSLGNCDQGVHFLFCKLLDIFAL